MNRSEVESIIEFLENRLEDNRRAIRNLEEISEKMRSKINLFYNLRIQITNPK